MPRITIHEPGKSPQPYRFDLATNKVKLGRADDNDIILECGSTSSHHAAMSRVTGGFELRDLGSTNGIEKNGSPVAVSALSNGDRLLLGKVEFTFELNDGETAALAAEVAPAPKKGKSLAVEAEPDSDSDSEPKPASPRRARREARDSTGPVEVEIPSGPSGGVLVLAFAVLGTIAFLYGASMRHNNETGGSFIGLILDGSGQPDAPEPAPAEDE